ncbi:MAG: hypothetical protein JXQ84_05285 [Rhodospirillaceae bacterium]|nr:hypothetical protein [Rhodospirillaceae bacterium]
MRLHSTLSRLAGLKGQRSAIETHRDDPTIDAVLAAATNIGTDYERLSVTKQNPGR